MNSKVVFHRAGENCNFVKRAWGVEHLPAITSENMEMHLKKVVPNSVGVSHVHTCDTLYYVMAGTLVSLSGEELSHVDRQPAGVFVCVPKGVVHTVANIGDTEVITVVAHNQTSVEETTVLLRDLEELAKTRIHELRLSNQNNDLVIEDDRTL
jgi:uncharacterized RmlC-like cupin family protein